MHSILVTGVGAIIGYGLVRSARECRDPLRIVGTDIYEDAVGQEWCDEFEQAVRTASPDFPEFLHDIVRRHSIDLVLPGIEQDVARISADADLFDNLPAHVVLNHPELVEIANDKWLTHLQLQQAGLPVINTQKDIPFVELSIELGLPFLLKPRRSYASKGIHEIHDERDFDYWTAKTTDEFVLQQIVGDEDSEYTVGLFGFGDGTASHILAMQRRLSPDGSTVKARVVVDTNLEAFVRHLIELFRPLGPTNMQFRQHDGAYLLLEINPRFSSSHSLRRAFGINDVDHCVQYFVHGRRPSNSPIHVGQAARFIEDIVTYDCNAV